MPIIKTYVVPHPPMIINEISHGREIQILKTITAYEKVAKEIAEIKPDTIIISSPHTKTYIDYFYLAKGSKLTGNFEKFNASEIEFNIDLDEELTKKISDISKKRNFPAGILDNDNEELDHGTMVPLYFINKYYENYKLVLLGISGLSFEMHYKMGQIIQEAVENINKKVVYIASGDLSHKLQTYGPYGFIKEGPIYDEKIIDILNRGDFLELLKFDKEIYEKAAVCGHKSFLIMAGALDGYAIKSKIFSHEDITGVGYGVGVFDPQIKDDKNKILNIYYQEEKDRITKMITQEDEYITIARKTINNYIENNSIKEINSEDNILNNEKRGVFVTIHKFNELRGCIGTIIPVTENIKTEIIKNAISAATNDYRFEPITKDELPYLEIHVDVLSPLEKISSIDELNPKKYGVIVISKNKRGVLLPDLEGVDTPYEQITIAKRKAGITDKEEIELERFEVIRHQVK